jgi:AcrR family transcriptional regulator
MSEPTTRTYRSSLRAEQAAATRRRVLDAAAASFIERGYHGTSLADIGVRAGVSTETVKANGPKRDLLLSAFEQAFTGIEGDAPIAEGEAVAALADLADADAFLAALAGFVAAANARTSVLWTEFLTAANTDETVARALTDLLERRHDDYLRAVGTLIERGIASPDTDPEASAAVLSFLWSPESHQQLVLQSGWDPARYERWLADAARRHLSR